MQNILLSAAIAAKQPCLYGFLMYKCCTLLCTDYGSMGFFLNIPFACTLFFPPSFLLLPSFIRRTKGKFLWESEVTATIIEFTTRKKKYPSICILAVYFMGTPRSASAQSPSVRHQVGVFK